MIRTATSAPSPAPHWAAWLIGKPWRAGACGPDAFDCRGLVDWCVRMRFGEELPTPETVHRSAWRLAGGPPQADDVVLMEGPNGRHVGYMVQANGRLGVLHADGYESACGPVGAVRFQTLVDSFDGGYHRHEFWRHRLRAPAGPVAVSEVDIELDLEHGIEVRT